jgi:hypothetical protein
LTQGQPQGGFVPGPVAARTIVFADLENPATSPHGRNHDIIAAAIAGSVDQILSVDEIAILVRKLGIPFSEGSLLPNDHAEGNRSSCGCSLYRGGQPLFERVGYGRYRVLDPQNPNMNSKKSGGGQLGQQASKWLRYGASAELTRMLYAGEPQPQIFSGIRGGRYVVVGLPLPQSSLTSHYSTSWSMSVDTTYNDYQLGGNPSKEPIYFGLRCGRNVALSDGAQIFRFVATLLPDLPWNAPDQYWPIWMHPTHFGEGGDLLSEEELRAGIIEQFVSTYRIVHDALIERG